MPIKPIIAWIFAFLILVLVFMLLFPKPWIIFTGIILLPILAIIQTYLILKGQHQEKKTIPKDQWYET